MLLMLGHDQPALRNTTSPPTQVSERNRASVARSRSRRKRVLGEPHVLRSRCSASALGVAQHRRGQSNRSRQRSTLSAAGWRGIGRPQASGRRTVSAREDLMVEICVAVDDRTRVSGLMWRLAGLFDRSSLSFDRSRNEVKVTSEWESRGVVHVVDAVEAWLAEDGGASATLSIGERSYTLRGSSPLVAN